ncbi:MAG: hypothetical protein IJN02_01915 [Bacteroidales bacterium]|nr:hypothetical protein [Bacteroidales bacterium]
MSYKKAIYILILNIFFCSCGEKKLDEQKECVKINIDGLQGYWKSHGQGIPVNVDNGGRITEKGIPAPSGLRNALQYYYNIAGNNVECYVTGVIDANLPEIEDNPVYTIFVDRNYSISVENEYKISTNIFENNGSYHVAADNDTSSIVLIREDQSNYGYTHISFSLNTTSDSEWAAMISDTIFPGDTRYNDVYEMIFNNF